MEFELLSPSAIKHIVDGRQLFDAWDQSIRRHDSLQGTMRFSRVNGADYLYRERSKRGRVVRRSLGVRSELTEKMMHDFRAAQVEAELSLNQIRNSLSDHAPFIVAHRMNRVPRTSAKVLMAMHKAGISGKATILGTNSLYAYEAALGGKFADGMLATGDIDIMLDTRRKLNIVIEGASNTSSLESIIVHADKSFKRHPTRAYALVDRKGFAVEFIKPTDVPPWRQRKHHPLASDIIPADIDQLAWLQEVPKFETIVFDEAGFPVPMRTVEPFAFAIYKAWMSRQQSRDPIKRRRDQEQAVAVCGLILASGYRKDLNADESHMPGEAIEAAQDLLDEAKHSHSRSRAADFGY